MNTINLQGSPRVKHQLVGTMRPKAVLKGYLRMPTLTKLEQRKILNATENGSYEVLPDENRTLSSVSVNVDVPIPEGYIDPEGTAIIASNGIHDITHYEFAEVNIPERKEEQEVTVNITKNGTTEIFPDENKVLSKATVNVNVPIPNGYIKPEGSMPITENGTFDVREKAEVNVQVVAKPEKPYIDSSKLKYGAYMFAEVNDTKTITLNTDLSLLQNLDVSEMVDIKFMFQNRKDLPNINFTMNNVINAENSFSCTVCESVDLELSEVTTLSACFQGAIIQRVNIRNSSKCTIFRNCFTAGEFHSVCVDTSSGEDFYRMFRLSDTINIDSELDFSKATNVGQAFASCNHLENVRFKAIKVFDNNLNFSNCSKLTVESLLSILNALSDNTGLDTTYTVTLGTANLAKLTQEQKMIAYSKNIALA